MTLTRQHRLRRLRWARRFQRSQHRNWQHVYYVLIRAGPSYSELMAGLGYTDVQERENGSVLCSVDYRLVVDLWPTVDRPYCRRRKSNALRYLHMVNILAIETFFVVKLIHLRYEWSYLKSNMSPLVNCDIIILWVLLSIVYSCLFIAKLLYFPKISSTFLLSSLFCFVTEDDHIYSGL